MFIVSYAHSRVGGHHCDVSPYLLKEFGFGLAVAVLLDALVVRCVLLPAALELLGPTTWRLPRWLNTRLPHTNIEGTPPRTLPEPEHADRDQTPETVSR
jgi:putative drug exporter of the RND superfamily